jgi:eukaryotic-like serine/threonine-protein kinase
MRAHLEWLLQRSCTAEDQRGRSRHKHMVAVSPEFPCPVPAGGLRGTTVGSVTHLLRPLANPVAPLVRLVPEFRAEVNELVPATSQDAPLIVGRYALFDAIASGGMAQVHIGRLLGAFGFSRTVAIKRLHRESALEPNFVAMFSDEARLAARIRHPNVVSTLDVVALGDELLLVMEYVSGAALSQILQKERKQHRPTPHRVAVDIMIGVLNGLHAAHEATSENGTRLDIVHRDVSPQNILVGADGIARVLDFGIAKAVGGTHHSLPNEIKGKLRYLSPESVTAQPVTRASDIYSASVVLWEMLAGRRLFDDKNNGEIILKVMKGATLPPSHFHPHISSKLDQIVMRGLNRDPAARYPTARAMAVALEAAVTAVTRSTVSEWVFASVGDEIRERDGLVARVERAAQAETHVSLPSEGSPADAVTEITKLEGQHTAHASGVITDSAGSASKRTRLYIGLTVAATACVLVLGWLGWARPAPEPLPLRSLPTTVAIPKGESPVMKAPRQTDVLNVWTPASPAPSAAAVGKSPAAVGKSPAAVGKSPAAIGKSAGQTRKPGLVPIKRPLPKPAAMPGVLYRRD